MKWLNNYRMRLVVVGFVAAVLLSGGVSAQPGEESLEDMLAQMGGTWTLKTDMPTARFLAGSAVVEGKIYVVGGAPVSGSNTNIAEEYDPVEDTWTRCANMPTSRQGVRAAAVDGIVYAIGGANEVSALATVEAYDPTTDTWTRKTSMPTARSITATAVVDGKIYVIGGENPIILRNIEVYDPATDTWTRKADLSTARWDLAADVVDGKIYVFGGARRWDQVPPIDLNVTPIVEVYDPATDTWTQASDMPIARFGHSATAVDGKIYIIGGADTAVHTPPSEGFLIVDVYDPATDTWTTAADLPAGGTNHTAGVVDGKIYTIGRWTGPGGDVFPTVQEFTPASEAKNLGLNVPDESPGSPSYADFGRDFIPADGTQVAIVFMRDPACVPPDFNLLDTMDIPASFECPFLLGGREWWHEPHVDFPFKCVYTLDNDGSLPVYFVDLAELDSEIADDQLTLGELETFSSLKFGQATYVRNDLLNSNAPDSDGKGHGTMTAIGTLDESGEFFYVHWREEFRPEIGKNVFLETVIRFFPGAN